MLVITPNPKQTLAMGFVVQVFLLSVIVMSVFLLSNNSRVMSILISLLFNHESDDADQMRAALAVQGLNTNNALNATNYDSYNNNDDAYQPSQRQYQPTEHGYLPSPSSTNNLPQSPEKSV